MANLCRASLQTRFLVRLHTSVRFKLRDAMRRGLLLIFFLVAVSSSVEAGCVDPRALAHSTVGITRHFDDGEKGPSPGVLAIRGTGWFLSPTSLVTVEHVAAAMNLADQSWKQV